MQQMPKIRTTFTLEQEVHEQLVRASKEKAINMSGLMNLLIKKWLEENK